MLQINAQTIVQGSTSTQFHPEALLRLSKLAGYRSHDLSRDSLYLGMVGKLEHLFSILDTFCLLPSGI